MSAPVAVERGAAAKRAAATRAEAITRFRAGYTIDSVARATDLSRPALRDIATDAGLIANPDGRTYTVPPAGTVVLTLVPAQPAQSGDWRDDAACASTDPEIFHPNKGESPRPAKNVCKACPVRAHCLEFALLTDQRYGVWGGTTEQERRRMRTARTRAAAAAA